MKRYTVKQVVKIEEKQNNLYQMDKEGLGEFYFMPFSLLTTMGICSIHEFSQSNEFIPLIMGSVAALIGVTNLAQYFSAGMRSDMLRDKLTKIYDIMGDDFKKQVEAERLRQEYEENRKSR